MCDRAEARRRLSLRIRRASWAASAALLGAGVGVSLSILFLAAGVALIGAGLIVAVLGTLASVTVPRLVY